VSPKRERFCEEYLIDLNQTQAAIRAGYSPKTAKSIAHELMQVPSIRSRIDTALAERSKRTGINADRVLRELARMAFVNAKDVIDLDSATIKSGAVKDDTAAIMSVKVKTFPTSDGEGVEREIRIADKLKALELLGRHLSMFTDNLNLTGEVGVQIIDDIPREAEGSDTAD